MTKLFSAKKLILHVAILSIAVATASYGMISAYSSRVIQPNTLTNLDSPKVGIVFGSGILENRPTPLLAERLDKAAELADRGLLDMIIVSGDNRFVSHNEPQVMLDYLVNIRGIDSSKIQPDFAGRSTYETCERASKIFKLRTAVLITESTHLPRALFLCSSFGIRSHGVASDGPAAAIVKKNQVLREVAARFKAVFNVYIHGEDTILGEITPICVNYESCE